MDVLSGIQICIVPFFAYLSLLGWPCIYSVYRSPFGGRQDSFLLDEIFLAFIQGDTKGKRLLRIIPFPI